MDISKENRARGWSWTFPMLADNWRLWNIGERRIGLIKCSHCSHWQSFSPPSTHHQAPPAPLGGHWCPPWFYPPLPLPPSTRPAILTAHPLRASAPSMWSPTDNGVPSLSRLIKKGKLLCNIPRQISYLISLSYVDVLHCLKAPSIMGSRSTLVNIALQNGMHQWFLSGWNMRSVHRQMSLFIAGRP